MDGAEVLRWFVQNGFRSFDFLLPEGNYANPPQNWIGPAPYKTFLSTAFAAWLSLGENAPSVRLFEFMMAGLLGAIPPLDALGGDIRTLCVVESDGGIGASDVLRLCGPPFDRDTLNIFVDPLDFHDEHYRVGIVQQPCEKCRRCSAFSACGGGYLPHRFDGASFSNPSIYCDALFDLSRQMTAFLRKHLPESAWVKSRN